jgi:glucose/arabinose dehydrogenase
VGQVSFELETVASGLEVPWSIAFLPDGDMLVTVRDGKLLRIKPDGTVVNPPVATLTLLPSGEGGLLGLALHPNFEENSWFYLYFTTELNGKRVNRVQRWIMAADGQSASPVDMIVDQIAAKTYHNGGRLRFGPDGKLYIGTGDAGVPEVSQDPQSLSGKILRLNDDGTIPEDNPFPGSAAYVIGVRNSQGFDWRDDGRLLIVDHGPSGFGVEDGRMNHDEVHIAEAGDNLGWPNIYACEESAGMRAPLMTWGDALPPGGAAIYRGETIPQWKGDLLVGVLGFGSDIGHLHRLQINEGGQVIRSEVYLHGAQGFGRMREVIMGPDGHLYVTTSNCDGRNECPPSKDLILRLK